MKRTWGISVYLGIKDIQQDIEYIKLAHKYGFTKIFTCFLGLTNENKELYLTNLENFMKIAVDLKYQVYIDLDPSIFTILGISYNELELFEKLQMAGIRLDRGFSGLEESIMSFNPNLEIMINTSSGTKYLDNIISNKPNIYNIVSCHNFYPRKFTGLSANNLMTTTAHFKANNIRVGAFVSSQNSNTFSNQSVMEGLPTLESHRGIPLINQVKELYYIYNIDDIIIGNSYATEEELKAVYHLDKYLLTLDVELAPNLPEYYLDMIFNNLHFNRGDASEYMLRSTELRIKYKGLDMPPFNTKPIKRGDITIDNNLYKKYKGELHIATQDMENTGNVNVVASVKKSDINLINYILPWVKFKFKQ